MLGREVRSKINVLVISFTAAIALWGFSACEKFLDIKPAGVVMPNTPHDFRALLTRAYQSHPTDLAKLVLRSDEANVNFEGENASYRSSYEELYTWTDNGSPSTLTPQWQGYYYNIYVANHLINLFASLEEVPAESKQLFGEAYLLRAYSYFLLANIYGQPYSDATRSSLCVPLMLDNEVETIREKSSLEAVYKQITQDIDASFNYLQIDKWDTPAHRYRFSKDAARAFACRVALYKGEWAKAIEYGKPLLAGQSYQLVDLNGATAKLPCHFESSESIMNLDLVVDGDYLKIIHVSQSLLNSYAKGDRRNSVYFKTHSLGNYSVERGDVQESEGRAYRITFRLGETLLNVAEAHARLGELGDAKTLLKRLAEKRYTKSELSVAEGIIDALDTQDKLLAYLLDERGRELAFEGLRWFDLRRFGCPPIVHKLDGKEYRLEKNDPRYTLPIPREAKESNSNL